MTDASIFIYRNCYTGGVAGGDVHMGGVASWIAEEYPKIRVTFIYPFNDGQEEVYPETVHLNKINYREKRISNSPSIIFLIRAFKGLRVKLPWHPKHNVLIASSHFLPDVLPVFWKGKQATKVVYIHHIVQDMPRPRTINTWLANLQEKICFSLIKRRFDKIVVVNQEVADKLRARGFTSQQILLSSNFVNQDKPRFMAVAKKDITVAFCGRMVPQKGINDFLKICAQLDRKINNLSVVMMGIGPEIDRIKEEIRQQNLPIKVPGFISDDMKFDYMMRARVFVFPSVEEGWGIAVAESLSQGTPVAAYDLPVYHDIFAEQLHTVPLHEWQHLAEVALQLYQKAINRPTTYTREQKRITTFSRQFIRRAVAEKEYRFLLENIT